MDHRDTDAPRPVRMSGIDPDLLDRCADACFTCAQVCLASVERRLGEAGAEEPTDDVRNGLGCADLCEATGMLLTQYPGVDLNLVRAFLDTCAAGCRAWADECDPDSEQGCREACLACEQACRDLAASL